MRISDGRPLEALLARSEPLSDYLSFVPKNALAFSVDAGIDPAGFFDFLVGGFRTMAPGIAERYLGVFEAWQRQVDFRIRDDLLGLLAGGTVSVTLPAVRPTPFGNTDSITLMRLNDPSRAAALLDQGLGFVDALLTGKLPPEALQPGSPLAEISEGIKQAPVKIAFMPFEGKGLRSARKLTISVMPFLQPVFGVYGEYFFMASSEAAIENYVAFLSSGGETVAEQEGFKSLHWTLPAKVQRISYKDAGAAMKEAAQFMGMIGPFAMMIPDEPETRPIKKMLGLLPRLASVLAAYDYLGYEGSYTVRDDETGISRTKKVKTFRLP